jgi:hypothetical protein
VHFDTALNLAWLVIGIFAFLGAAKGFASRPRIASIALVVAALLFPYISATDDVLRIEHLRGQQKQTSPSQRAPNDDLIRLYQTMDTPMVPSAVQVSVTLFFVLLVITPAAYRIFRNAPFESGRSPPLFS